MTTLETINLRSFPPVDQNIGWPDTLSQTLLSKHDLCPRSAYLYRKYNGGPGSLELDRGIALHETIERAQKLMLDSDEPTMPGEVARDLAEAVMQERKDLVLSASEQDRVRGMAWNFAESPQGMIDREALVGIELSMEFEVAGFRVTCRLDRVDVANSTLYVTDYKSGFPGKQEDTDRSFQGQTYGAALLFGNVRDDDDPEKRYEFGAGINDVYFHEVFPRIRDEETGSLFVREAVWSRAELAEFKSSLERNVEAFADSLETGDWPARDGSWCGRCPAATECPIPAHLREIDVIESEEEAEIALSHKLALKKEGERIQRGLREYFKANGVFFVGDYAFDASFSESKSVKDWSGLQAATQAAARTGEVLDETPYVTNRSSTKYQERKLTPDEREELDGRPR